MDLQDICNEITTIKGDMKELSASVTATAQSVSKIVGKLDMLKTTSDVLPMLIRWVIFPLVSILATGYGIKLIMPA